MIGIFKRRGRDGEGAVGGPGPGMLAVRLAGGAAVPAGCAGVVCDQGGGTRRLASGARALLNHGAIAFCFHPGPHAFDLRPFASAPEIGLRATVAVDSPDPRLAQQRFDLYLMSEAGEQLALADFGAAIEAALQRELAQGHLELPPCTTLDEWNAFRAGFNQLLYTRFGVTVDDCLPLDLGAAQDYAALLLARAAAMPAPVQAAAPAPAGRAPLAAPAAALAPASDAQALRRLFLELPCVMCALRLAVLPPGQALFRQHQALLQRLDQVSLGVNTMPALGLAAPGVALEAREQQRRMGHTLRAVDALDEAWALLARLKCAAEGELAGLFDDADRIVANLETATAGRRLACAAAEAT